MLDDINSRLDIGEEKTGELEGTLREFIQNENGTNNFFFFNEKDHQFSGLTHVA